jgi:MtrB/PioB family decaheme-associated outer membrane protein
VQRLTIALVLALSLAAPAAAAQDPPAKPQPPAQPQPPATEAAAVPDWKAYVDFGGRGTHVNGDGARYERYRDLSDGLFLETARLQREARGWIFEFDGDHVGRRDQRYIGRAVDPGKYRASFMWDQIPMLLSDSTQTLYSGIGTGVLTIDDALQAIVQARPPAMATVFDEFARTFETRTLRTIVEGAFEYMATESLAFSTSVRHTDRDGTIPFGGSFGHSSLVEMPAPVQQTLSDFNVGAEYAKDRYLFRAGYAGSWFHNDITSVAFDNPFRAIDSPGTSSRGRLTLAPSNSFISVNGMASVKLPYNSRVIAYASLGSLEDDGDAMVPQTINTSITPRPVERSTVDGEARTSSVNLRFVSRPARYADITVSYRLYDYDNRTPQFAMIERVAYDNTPAAVSPPIHTDPYGLTRGTFDADFRFVRSGRTSAGIGYTRVGEDRTYRIFESTTDNVLRLTFDSVGQGWFSIRSKYEHARRLGEGIEQGEALLASIGEQPKLRHFDIAARDRDRVTVIGSISPIATVTANVSVAAGKDDFHQSEFGVRDNTHQVLSAGVDYIPHDRVTLAASYSFEEYDALQRSRQANPGEQFTDPSRNWAADTSDRSHSVFLNADVTRIKDKVDLRLSYDFNRVRGRYDYITGPVPDRTLPEEVIVPTTLPPPTALPPTLSELQRATIDLSYTLTTHLAAGASYWYEQYRVEDFTLDVDANPDLARGQTLLLGYLYRPYSANTWWVRLLYRW